MRGTRYLIVSILAASVASFGLGPMLASATADFLTINTALVKTSPGKVDKAAFITDGVIPTDGSYGAFGYGIITGSSAIVNTSHRGVLDSALQVDENDPANHNHYAILGTDEENCGEDPAVLNLTFESPGSFLVQHNTLLLNQLPQSSEGISQDDNVQNAVSFTLQPVFEDDTLVAVCVTNIAPAEQLFVR